MSERQVSQGVKMTLELGPVLLFFVAYTILKDETFTVAGVEYSGFVAVTAAFIPLLLAVMGVLWRLSGKLSRMQAATAVIVVAFGGMSVWFNDERFFKMKPTVLYALFAIILGAALLRGKSALRYVMDEAIHLDDQGWMKLTRRTAAFFAALALANELVWRTMSTDAWVNFKTFGVTLAVFLFFGINIFRLAATHSAEPRGTEE